MFGTVRSAFLPEAAIRIAFSAVRIAIAALVIAAVNPAPLVTFAAGPPARFVLLEKFGYPS